MADQLEHVTVNVEAAIAHRLHMEAQHIRDQADLHDQEYRDLLAEAARAPDLNQKARLQRQAERKRMERERFRTHAVETQALARKAVHRAESLPNDTSLDRLEPETRRPLTKQEVKQREEEAHTIAWQRLRDDRDDLLRGTDWTQAPDAPVDQAAWRKYRQQLRDLPNKTSDPLKAKWPTRPDGG